MEAAETAQNLKEMPYPPQKSFSFFFLKKENNITPAKTNASISQTS